MGTVAWYRMRNQPLDVRCMRKRMQAVRGKKPGSGVFSSMAAYAAMEDAFIEYSLGDTATSLDTRTV